MTQFDSDRENGHDCIDLDDRDVRALTEYLTVLDDIGRAAGADDMYLVVSESGSEYLVDVRLGACECPDAEYRDPEGGCKHVRRAQFATGRRPIPEWADADALDDQLGAHADNVADAVATDGGELLTDTDGEDEGADTDECECDGLPDDVPCFSCYQDGAEFPEGI